jgi:hypothetical protein
MHACHVQACIRAHSECASQLAIYMRPNARGPLNPVRKREGCVTCVRRLVTKVFAFCAFSWRTA